MNNFDDIEKIAKVGLGDESISENSENIINSENADFKNDEDKKTDSVIEKSEADSNEKSTDSDNSVKTETNNTTDNAEHFRANQNNGNFNSSPGGFNNYPNGAGNYQPGFNGNNYNRSPYSQNPYNNKNNSFSQNQFNGYPNYQNQNSTYNQQPDNFQPNTNNEKPKKSGAWKVVIALVLCVTLSLGSGMLGAYIVQKNNNATNSGSGLVIKQNVENEQSDNKTSTNKSYVRGVAEKVANSVVEITTESVTTGAFMQQYISSGAGSGVIVSDDGYIITNNHVVSGATNITVTLKNGEVYNAKIIGTDSELDTALIKIEATGLTSAVFGDSSKLNVGDDCVAIGNPLGQLGGTVTNGIISALNRDIDIDGVTMNLLQTNAAINPGNSGGGLFDENGNLIGLVVAKSSGSDVEGLGFAIPINDVKDILGDLKEYGYVKGRIYLGMSFVDVNNAQTAMMYGVSSTGVYVSSVYRGTNAEEAGFVSGDRIKTVDSKEVSSYSEIVDTLKDKKVGDSVEFLVVRTSKFGTETEQNITLTLEEYDPTASNRITDSSNSQNNSQNNNDGSEGFNYDDFKDYFEEFFGGMFGGMY